MPREMVGADIKLYIINALSLVISMTDLEPVLKILLLMVTIGYTVNKWYHLRNKK
jgi:hypothetical protein